MIKNPTILFPSTQYTISRRRLRNSITQVVREREFIAQCHKKINLLITRDAHASPGASQKAQFIKSLQLSYFQPIVKQIVVIKFTKFTLV